MQTAGAAAPLIVESDVLVGAGGLIEHPFAPVAMTRNGDDVPGDLGPGRAEGSPKTAPLDRAAADHNRSDRARMTDAQADAVAHPTPATATSAIPSGP